MIETTYTRIDKKIGTEGEASFPCKAKALELWRKVTDEHCVEAFEEVFKVFRFCKVPKNHEESEVFRLIVDTFAEGQKIFNKQ